MLDQRLGVAQRHGPADHRQAVHHRHARRVAALQLEGDHAAARAHLALGQGALREALQARIEHRRHGRMRLQPASDRLGAVAVARHPQRQGLQAAHDQEGGERRHHRAGHVLYADQPHAGHVLDAADGDAAHQVAVTAQILGRRVDDDVGAQGQRPGQHRRGVGVVDHHLGPCVMGDAADGGDVHEAHVRIGRGLEIDDPGLVRDRLGQRLGPGHVDRLQAHAEPGQSIAQEGVGAAIQRLVGDHLVAGPQEAP